MRRHSSSAASLRYVDVRRADAFARGRPRGAVRVAFSNNDGFDDDRVDASLPREPGRVVVGGGGRRDDKLVAAAADDLRRRGYDAVAMAGGFEAWRGLGLPVDVDGVGDDVDDDDGDPSTWS